MIRLATLFTTGALVAAMVVTPTVAVAADNAPKVVKLPFDGPLYMRETSAGATVIVSKDGRFVMPGRLVDRQESHTVISTVEEAVKAFGGESESTSSDYDKSSDLVNEEGLPNVDKVLSFTVGSGPTVAYIWVDPLCPYCHSVVAMQEELSEEFTFHNLIVPLLGERSERATDALACMPEGQRYEAMSKNQYSNATQDCDSKGMANSQRLATIMQVDAVPTIISQDRRSVTGAPETPEQLASFLRSAK